METSYRELKCKYVVNVTDGKNLGKTCDIVFTFPEGRVIGIAVPGKSGIRLFRRRLERNRPGVRFQLPFADGRSKERLHR